MKNIVLGSVCSHLGKNASVQKFIDYKNVIIKYSGTGELHIVPIGDLEFSEKSIVNKRYVDSISDEDWKIAQDRYSIIKPLIDAEINSALEVNKSILVKELSAQHNVGYVTIYRWLNAFHTTGLVSALAPTKRPGGKGKSRLDKDIVNVMDDVINEVYLTSQRLSKKATAIEVIRRCKNAGLDSPHYNTVYNRIKTLDQKRVLTKRLGYLDVSQKIDATPGVYEEAMNPLDIIQIDHTPLDIIVVDEKDRNPIGRPNITLAIDVYSRMIAGFFISFDPPGALSTGICLASAILPKDEICEKYELKTEWPLWGVMRNVHMDNAKEFKGTMIKRASEEYGFTIIWRPKGKSRYGAHVERLLGTLSKKIHALPGTTFENIKYRSNYNSEAKAVMTLPELEEWLHIQIVDVYHNEFHTGIGASPLQYYNEAIFGSDRKEGIGVPMMKLHPEKVYLDFLPHIERSIQRSGVVIDHIRYYSDIFRNYLFEKAWNSSDRFVKNLRSKNFIFKRDPRDISKIYFLDEKEARYVEIPYADMRRSPMSIWDHRAAIKKAKELFPKNPITEDIIFSAHNRLKEIEENAIDAKKESKRIDRKRKVEEFKKKVNPSTNVKEEKTVNARAEELPFSIDDIEPFEYDEEV